MTSKDQKDYWKKNIMKEQDLMMKVPRNKTTIWN